jgi:hypothetical protein
MKSTYSDEPLILFAHGHLSWPKTTGKRPRDVSDPIIQALILEYQVVNKYRKKLLLNCAGALIMRRDFEAALDPLCSTRFAGGAFPVSATPKWQWCDRLGYHRIKDRSIATYKMKPLQQFMEDIKLQSVSKDDNDKLRALIGTILKSPCVRSWDQTNDDLGQPGSCASEIIPPLTALYRVRIRPSFVVYVYRKANICYTLVGYAYKY